MEFKEWVGQRMACLGLRTVRRLAEEVGVTEKTMGEILNRPDHKRDPAVILWLSRVLQVRPDELEAARAGRGPRLDPQSRARWDFYELTRQANLPAVSDALLREFEAVAGPIYEGSLADAMTVYIAVRRTPTGVAAVIEPASARKRARTRRRRRG